MYVNKVFQSMRLSPSPFLRTLAVNMGHGTVEIKTRGKRWLDRNVSCQARFEFFDHTTLAHARSVCATTNSQPVHRKMVFDPLPRLCFNTPLAPMREPC